ncbi:MAG: DUF58 domain-containing protein [Bernardetiaceae bacterium]|nr:DUF58 domain-containing protein [Bernardetiaceae bacterium]
MRSFLRSLYLNQRLFWVVTGCVVVFLLGFGWPFMLVVGKFVFFGAVGLLLVDILMLYRVRQGLLGSRLMADKLSNGDHNRITLQLQNQYNFTTHLTIWDELPEQFQERNFKLAAHLTPGQAQALTYTVRPVRRGEYSFGALNVYASTSIGFVARRYKFAQDFTVPVYPSYIQMRKYELYAISNRLTELGIKKIRKIGQNMEFDQIRNYVQGDDYRSVNWKATARRNNLMVNQFRDERSQQVYSVIDKGRMMKMPFNGMTLLDYAINAALVISNIAIKKSDKAGLITFGRRVATTLGASNRGGQMMKIMETLYNQKTGFKEPDFEALATHIRSRLNQRSLILLYTNFETLSSMERQLYFMRSIAKQHLLVVVCFKNTELHGLLNQAPKTTEEIYQKTVAEKFMYEKQLIVKELNRHGIHTILTAPENLTVNTINKYLELKARNLI